jgi:excisionase family DNA binding protein
MSQTELLPMLKMKEAMTYLRISRSTLYRLMWSGQLTSHKVGGTMRFYKADLDGCIQRAPAEPPPCLVAGNGKV